MPVVVTSENFECWFTDPDPEEAATLLCPAPDDFFEAFQVSDCLAARSTAMTREKSGESIVFAPN